MDKLLTVSVAHFSHLQNGDNNTIYPMGLLWKLNELLYVMSAIIIVKSY